MSMNSDSDSSTNSSRTAGRRVSRSTRFALTIVVIYAILLAGLCWGSIVGHVLFLGLVSAAFLAVYVAGPLAFVLWAAFMAHRLFIRKNRGSIFRAGLKSAGIIFGTIGLVLWIVAMIPPNARTFSAGYWFHAKVWADVEEIRAWAARRTPSPDRFEHIPTDQWPASLRRMAVSGGTVTCDPKNFTVIFYEGCGYGHWGLTVAAPGTPPPADRHAIKLQDGAWVWHE
ncbi:MAG: hypothetical protein ISS69_15300 [Phycisphaerae bacterium]|nr:hypothetical protein [Phycisphaerae bacterium]